MRDTQGFLGAGKAIDSTLTCPIQDLGCVRIVPVGALADKIGAAPVVVTGVLLRVGVQVRAPRDPL